MAKIMENILKDASQESIQAGEKFIHRIKSGILKKNTLPNKSDDYPLEKASKNYKAYLESEDFADLINQPK
ncbi:hypothetical protein [Leptospira idonii]|uniref:Uncharacterized protein n=1 Tax=Leptospira idonii TaxID=1193500 RepID=A0A4R9LWV0_9LEPT|nr:hypothetical protein [Leptospira idonii]TGN17349.1 hypothetical protein EHS15_17600 [Leptospira idonii]